MSLTPDRFFILSGLKEFSKILDRNWTCQKTFAVDKFCIKSSFEATCRQSIAPIVAAARCLVSVMGMQRLQRIAGRTLIREETIGSLKELGINNEELGVGYP
ncbi:MAG: hypothetical protein WCL14_14870 [Bacteroidota bacterium]